MNKKLQVPLDDETDYGLCFACGPRNTAGLHLEFEKLADSVKTTYSALEEHQGFPGYLHGGIISTLLDEVMNRISVLENQWTMTGRMDVRFRRPVMIGQTVTVIGRKIRGHGRVWEVQGSVRLPSGTLAAEATGTYILIPSKKLLEMSTEYPRLNSEWLITS